MMKPMSVLMLLILLSACAGLGTLVPVHTVYDFGPVPQAAVKDRDWSLLALEVTSPYRFDKPGIAYRLLYDNPNALNVYTESRWSAAPTVLLRYRLEQSLGFGSDGKTCTLRISIDEFTQHIVTPTDSTGVMQGRAYLLDERQTVRAGQTIFLQAPAPSVDAAGAVAALAAVSDQLVQTLDRWLREQQDSGVLAGC